ncbi:MAG: OB-fold domain-containing protein [Pseudomonadota bacterium]
MTTSYLAPGLAVPVPRRDGLDTAYWTGLRDGVLNLQRCEDCGRFQWGPEWICHRCHSFELSFLPVEPRGRIYSYERVWHPVHPALAAQGPYLIVLVELPHADDVRLVGNLLGDAEQPVTIGAEVEGVFEHHPDAEAPHSLLQWRLKTS